MRLQDSVAIWMGACFGRERSEDAVERNHRFLEEALELVQACGCTEDDAHELVRYVYGREDGDINQELGGVLITLAAMCAVQGFDMQAAADKELERIWKIIDQIRAKDAAKQHGSPLPGSVEK